MMPRSLTTPLESPIERSRRRAGFGAAVTVALAVIFAGSLAIPAGADIETLYVVQLSHADVGFNAPPTVMRQRNHDRTVVALDLADRYPDFHWTVETVWQLENFLDLAAPSDLARLRAVVRQGRFALGANYTNLHSGLCSAEEIDRLLHTAHALAGQYGVTFDTALLDDVPGFSMAIPRVLAAGDVPFAVLGANSFIGGKPDIPLGKRPFWWKARNGSRVLTWLTYGSYIEGYFDWGLVNLSTAFTKVSARIAEFEADGYPYDSVLVLRGSDDEIPNDVMVKLARDWNAKYDSPKIRLATAAEFFRHITNTYGTDFPVYTGDAAGMWESVSAVTPATHALVRQARTRLPALQIMWQTVAGRGGEKYPSDRFTKAWNAALIFDEHSGGGMGWPGLLTEAEINQENREFVALARRCASMTDALEREVLDIIGPVLADPDHDQLILFNPIGSTFDGVVEIAAPNPLPLDLRLIDGDGGPDATFRWLDDARTVIALETTVSDTDRYHRWQIARGGDAPPPPGWSNGSQVNAGPYQLKLDEALGTAVSLYDQDQKIDWIQQAGPHRFGGIEFGDNLDTFFGIWSERNPQPVQILIEDQTPALFRRMRVYDQSGQLLLREYRLFAGPGPRVDVIIFLRRSLLPFVPFEDHSHHYAVSFPANLTPPTTLHVDGPDGWYRPGPDSLPGAALGHHATSTGARLVDAAGRWMSITSSDTAMVDLGEQNEGPSPEIETDEIALTWKLIRHADLGEVRGGRRVAIEAEPGMPDEIQYHFTIRFGQANDPPPDRDTMRRDIAPPPWTWVKAAR